MDAKRQTGFIDRTGAVKLYPADLPEAAVLIWDFSDGLAPVAINPQGKRPGMGFSYGQTLFGFLDMTGRLVIEPKYDYTHGFRQGLAHVYRGEFEGIVNKAGDILVDLKKDCNEFPPTGIRFGRCKLRFKEGGFIGEYSEGLVAFANPYYGPHAKYGFADRTGRMLIAPRFEPEYEGHGFIRELGKFVNGMAKVKINGLYGFINKRGAIVIKPRFSTAEDFSEGLSFVVENNGSTGYIGVNGRWAIRSTDWTAGGRFSEGMAAVGRPHPTYPGEHVWGYIDRRGRMVIEPRFISAREFVNGVASIHESNKDTDTWDSKFGYIDRKGRYLWKPGSTLPQKNPMRLTQQTRCIAKPR